MMNCNFSGKQHESTTIPLQETGRGIKFVIFAIAMKQHVEKNKFS